MNIKSIGRNDPCPCGSGKKFKQCCQNKEINNSEAAKNRLLESIPDLSSKARQATLKNDLMSAEKIYLDILAINPKHIQTLNNLGLLKQGQGDNASAIIYLEKVVKLEPSAATHSNLGISLMALERKEEAIKHLKLAIEINPGDYIAHTNLGIIYCSRNNYKDGYIHLNKSLQINPNYPVSLYNLAAFLMRQGKYKKAEEYFKRTLDLAPNYLTYQHYLFCLCFDEKAFPYKYLELAKNFENFYLNKRSFMFDKWPNSSDINASQLKIGFVSGDLRNHPVGFFIENIIYALNKNKTMLFAYSNSTLETELTLRIKPNFNKWYIVKSLTDEQLAQQIYNDGIDILIDLSGYTAHNRLNMFAYKPAPIQVSWLGFFASTGLSFIDYFIADPIAIPKDKQFYFSEKIYYMPETRLCFTPPNDDIATPNKLPLIRNQYITFGCFQNLSKINDITLPLWSKILKATEGKLLIKSPQLDDPLIKLEFLEYLESFNILEDKIILQGHSSREDYLNSYHNVDFMLDTFPYPGGTTTCEALWMGVPTLTLTGNTLLERQGHSMLYNAGLENWVCTTAEQYIQKAIEFSKQIDYLSNLRQNLRQQVKLSPLMNSERFALNFENALFDIWQQHHK
ncbi:MAG: tetratricopeptide repeat protein [Agitococcus sp.]